MLPLVPLPLAPVLEPWVAQGEPRGSGGNPGEAQGGLGLGSKSHHDGNSTQGWPGPTELAPDAFWRRRTSVFGNPGFANPGFLNPVFVNPGFCESGFANSFL